MRSWLKATENGASPCDFSGFRRRGAEIMKQLNVWPLAMLLICVVLLVIWLRPH
jgi:hypothetical protein